MERTPTKSDYILGDAGIKVPKGGLIVIPAYAVHHDPEYFPDPFTFKPERFVQIISSICSYLHKPFSSTVNLNEISMVMEHFLLCVRLERPINL